ncbi:MAG: hypothetical protein ACPGRX_08140 [Bdellovibrionales bacterium]
MEDAFQKPLPEFESIPMEAFTADTTLREDTPFGDEYLAFEVRLPEGWGSDDAQSVGNFQLSESVLGEVARYFGPVRPGFRSYFSVQVVGMKYQLTTEQWFKLYLLENGYSIQGLDVLDDGRVEAIYVVIENDVTYVVRAVAEVNGKRAVLAQYVMPVEQWQDEKLMQERVVGSFRLLNKDTNFIEVMKPYYFLDVAEMQYPESWALRSKPLRSVDHMDVQLLNTVENKEHRHAAQLLNGKIEVHLFSAYSVDDLEQQIEDFKHEVQGDGLLLQDIIEEPDDFDFNDNVEFARVQVFGATDQNKSVLGYEFWFTVMAARDYYYFVTLLTPSRNDDFLNWARNTQTFRSVNALISPLDSAVSD